ncbi:MAG: MFS transporter, partial [Promethearchaeota archaeon]
SIVGFTTLSMAGFGVLFGYLSDLIKRVRVAFIGSVLLTVFSFLTSISQNFVQLFIFQLFASFGYGSITPVMFSIFSDLFSADKRASSFGLLNIVTGIFSGIVASILIVNMASIDWRIPYIFMGFGTLIFTPLTLLIPEPKRGASEEELKTAYEDDPTLQYAYKIKIKDIKYLWKRPTNLFLILNLVDNVSGGIIFTYAIDWLYFQHNVLPDTGVYIILLIALISFFGTFLFAKIGDKRYLKDKKIRIKMGIILSIIEVPFLVTGFLLDWRAPDNSDILQLLLIPIILLNIILLAIGLWLDSGILPNWMSAITEVNLPEQRGTMISLANFFDALGRTFGIFLGAVLIDSVGYIPAMTMAGVFAVISFVIWVPGLKYVEKDVNSIKEILAERAKLIKQKKSN